MDRRKINFNKRLVSDSNLKDFLKVASHENLISGGAVRQVLEDMIKLKDLCRTLVEVYKGEMQDEMASLIQILEIIL